MNSFAAPEVFCVKHIALLPPYFQWLSAKCTIGFKPTTFNSPRKVVTCWVTLRHAMVSQILSKVTVNSLYIIGCPRILYSSKPVLLNPKGRQTYCLAI